MWQALRSELHPLGLEVVTVALDTGGIDAARPWIERAKAEHPSLIDQAHVMDALFGIVNVPCGVWIDENEMRSMSGPIEIIRAPVAKIEAQQNAVALDRVKVQQMAER